MLPNSFLSNTKPQQNVKAAQILQETGRPTNATPTTQQVWRPKQEVPGLAKQPISGDNARSTLRLHRFIFNSHKIHMP